MTAARFLVSAAALVAIPTLAVDGRVADAQETAPPRERARIDFVWAAPEECPRGVRIEAEVAKLLAQAPARQKWRAHASVTQLANRQWALHLSTEVDGRKEERDFTAPTCADLAATTAVVLAIAVDPHLGSLAPSVIDPEPPPAPPPLTVMPPPETAPAHPATSQTGTSSPWPQESPDRSPAKPSRTDPQRPPPRSARSPLLSFAVAAGGSASLGVLGTPAGGALGGVAWTPSAGKIELDALWFPSTDVAGSTSGTGGTFSLVGAALSGCWFPIDRRFSVGPCVGAQAGALRARGTGAATTPLSTTTSWLAGQVGPSATWHLAKHVGLRASVDLLVPFLVNRFYVHAVDDIHTPSAVGGQAFLGVEAPFL